MKASVLQAYLKINASYIQDPHYIINFFPQQSHVLMWIENNKVGLSLDIIVAIRIKTIHSITGIAIGDTNNSAVHFFLGNLDDCYIIVTASG